MPNPAFPPDPPALFGNLFLSAGAMKAGTTWLFSVLNHHPELYFTPEKEIHYFYHRYVDSRLLSHERRLENTKSRHLGGIDPKRSNIDRVRYNLAWLVDYLSQPVDDLWYRRLFSAMRDQRYGGDFSNLYALLPAEAWARIAADCGRLRVLYTLRDPVRRLWSHLKFHLQISGGIDRLDTWSPGKIERFVRRPFLWDNAEYGRNLRAMKAGLPEGCLKVIFYEDLHADQRGTLAEIETFLGLTPFAYPERALRRRLNEGAARPMPDVFADLFAADAARIAGELVAEGLKVPDSWGAAAPDPAPRKTSWLGAFTKSSSDPR